MVRGPTDTRHPFEGLFFVTLRLLCTRPGHDFGRNLARLFVSRVPTQKRAESNVELAHPYPAQVAGGIFQKKKKMTEQPANLF